eukprot:m.348967 g.348967  ORF g.348967 m.348967 type:complete len:152 (+) comp39689_c0_seq1:59-514(+)
MSKKMSRPEHGNLPSKQIAEYERRQCQQSRSSLTYVCWSCVALEISYHGEKDIRQHYISNSVPPRFYLSTGNHINCSKKVDKDEKERIKHRFSTAKRRHANKQKSKADVHRNPDSNDTSAQQPSTQAPAAPSGKKKYRPAQCILQSWAPLV